MTLLEYVNDLRMEDFHRLLAKDGCPCREMVVSFIIGQGASREFAEEWIFERSRNPKNFGSKPFKGKMISFSPTSQRDIDKVNAMIESGCGPYLQTDVEFMAGTENGRQFQDRPEAGNVYKRQCEKDGDSILGKKYLSSLARYPGDREAFVSGRGDVARICEERGLGCDGAVTVKQVVRDEAPKESVALAPDILADAVQAQVAGKDLSHKEVGDITEKTRDALTPSWKNRSIR